MVSSLRSWRDKRGSAALFWRRSGEKGGHIHFVWRFRRQKSWPGTRISPATQATWSLKSYGLYPSHDALQVIKLLEVVASVYTPLPPGRNNSQPLRPFARSLRNGHFLPYALRGKTRAYSGDLLVLRCRGLVSKCMQLVNTSKLHWL